MGSHLQATGSQLQVTGSQLQATGSLLHALGVVPKIIDVVYHWSTYFLYNMYIVCYYFLNFPDTDVMYTLQYVTYCLLHIFSLHCMIPGTYVCLITSSYSDVM